MRRRNAAFSVFPLVSILAVIRMVCTRNRRWGAEVHASGGGSTSALRRSFRRRALEREPVASGTRGRFGAKSAKCQHGADFFIFPSVW